MKRVAWHDVVHFFLRMVAWDNPAYATALFHWIVLIAGDARREDHTLTSRAPSDKGRAL